MSLVSASKSVATRVGHGEPQVPRRLGKYRVLFELGRGGMATVYLAVTESGAGVSKLVAVKALLPEYANEADACAMFLDEARLAVQLNHGNVVQTYEVGQEGGRELIVMEYLEGQSLANALKRAKKRGQPLPLGLHLRLLMQVLEGLHCTHELRGYGGAPLHPVHRDVSPQNVFITYDGRAKVLDFGIAKATSSTTHTAAGLVKGKIAYMSPEQMSGEAVDRRADVYAVGCMLWAAASGRKLWADVADVKIMHDVMNDAIPTPRSQNPECEPELERIVMKALARAGERYATALELHDELERFCEAKAIPDRSRELGRFVSELFAEDRAELRASIERELSRLQDGVAVVLTKPFALPEQQQLTSSTQTVSASTVNELPPKLAETRPRWPWGVVAVAAAAVVAYLALPRPSGPSLVAPEVQDAPTAARAPANQPATMKLEVRSRPATAQLFLDDRPIEGNPALQILPKDGAVHRLRAELPGYRTASAELVASGDQVLDLNLEEIARAPGSGKRAAPRPPAQNAAGPRTSAPAKGKSPDCSQIFYVGADGIKKVKPGCL